MSGGEMMSTQEWTLVSAVLGGFGGSLLGASMQYLAQRRQYRLEDAAEKVLRRLLRTDGWTLRSFEAISHHVGGFTEDELRKMLVRVGALRFKDGDGREMWGLLCRNGKRLSKG